MGVPKFFRWISERYPLCSHLIQDSNVPVFDNLYLDMNGIIHNCSHGNSDDVHMRIPEDKIFINIFTYINHLFATIKPKKLFFMAIDGVAPRAKINQQRSRRFRTAFEAEEGVRKALLRGEELPEDPAFDSNCITPGTEFMQKLSESLKYFINKKLHEDPTWRQCAIVLSGPDVPGEGEHKIMEYIRHSRSQSSYNPNTRHCLYGLDADLIMLGLLSHDPHFCLLREEVVFGPQQRLRRIQTVEDQKFYLMHLSILREYLEKEFLDLKPKLPFEFSVENIIDDFILMALFVGNDFLPHLPDLHINEGALALMFDLYKDALPEMGGYMNDQGKINFDRLERLLLRLSTWEQEKYQEEKNIAQKPGGLKGFLTIKQSQILELVSAMLADTAMQSVNIKSDISKEDFLFARKLSKELFLELNVDNSKNIISICRKESEIDDEDELYDEESHLARVRVLKKYSAMPLQDSDKSKNSTVSPRFAEMKSRYYQEKLGISGEDIEQLLGIYAQGLQWVMDYYYNGVKSWNWFFPYHYAPRVSDLAPGIKRRFEKIDPFKLGTPFRPFEQLLAVLPLRSKMLLPEPLRELMYDKSSPILDFYPTKFETDLNGKKNEWEAIVKIPFIDEKRLLKAMAPRIKLISANANLRNFFGESVIFSHDTHSSFDLQSTIPGILPDILKCNVKMETFSLPLLDNTGFMKTLHPNVKLGDKLLPGFPSLQTIPHNSHIARGGVKVFQSESRGESVIVSVLNKYHDVSIEHLAESLIGTRVFVNWPYLTEAIVVKICDSMFEYSLEQNFSSAVYIVPRPIHVHRRTLEANEVNLFLKSSERMESEYLRCKGIATGSVDVILHVSVFKRMKRLDNGATVKEFFNMTELQEVPLQCLVENVDLEDERYLEKPPIPIEQEFPVGTIGFYLGEEKGLFGAQVRVIGHSKKRLNLEVVTPQADFKLGAEIYREYKEEDSYFHAQKLGKELKLHPLAISRICSSVYVITPDGKKADVGLKIKFEGKQQKVIGFTRRTERGWEFSKEAVELIREYHSLYPRLFKLLEKPGGHDIPVEFAFDFPDSDLKALNDWIKKKKIRELEPVATDVEILPRIFITKLESLLDSCKIDRSELDETQKFLSNTPAQFVLLPNQSEYRLNRGQSFKIGDRVVFVPESGASGILLSGAVATVVGTERVQYASMKSQKNEKNPEIWAHLLLDKPVIGATTLGNLCSQGRGVTVRSSTLLNVSFKQPPVHRRMTEMMSREPQPIRFRSDFIQQGYKYHGPKQEPQNTWKKRGAKREMLSTLMAAREVAEAASRNFHPSSPSQQPEHVAAQLKSMLNIEKDSMPQLTKNLAAQKDETTGKMSPQKIPAWLLSTMPTSVIQSSAVSDPANSNQDSTDSCRKSKGGRKVKDVQS